MTPPLADIRDMMLAAAANGDPELAAWLAQQTKDPDALAALTGDDETAKAWSGKHGPPPFPGAVLSGNPQRWHVPAKPAGAKPKPGKPTSEPAPTSGTITPQIRKERETAAKTVKPPKYVHPPPEPRPSPKAAAALKTAPKIGVNEQSYAEDYNEVRMATLLGGGSFPDSEECDLKIAVDPAVGEKWSADTRAYREQMTAWKDGGKKGKRPELPPLEGEVKHLCEMKTPVVGQGGISMNAYAIVRKVLLEKATKKPYHTIVCDHRAVFNANGPGDHGDPDNEVLYYRRGVGNAVIPDPDEPGSGSLYRCKDRAELETLMDTPDDELPEMAKRRDQDWHRGTWRPLKGERGYVRADGYKLDENGEPLLGPDGKKQVKLQIVRPKP